MPRFHGGYIIMFVAALLVTSLLIFSMTMSSSTRVSAVETKEVGVYWDSYCDNKVSSIDWETPAPGSVKSVVVYIRNEDLEPMYLIMLTKNWNPSRASNYMTLRWDYVKQRIDPNEVLKTNLILSVSPYIEGISNFSFDILIAGSQNLPGDINGNGRVDLGDLGKFRQIYSGYITDPELLSRADVNYDGKINLADLGLLRLIYSGFL